MIKKPDTSNIDWPSLVFYASLENEAFADIQFVTLYAHCLNKAQERNTPINKISAAEHIEVFEDRVLVVIDEDVIDDDTILKGLDYLTNVEKFDVGTKVELGPKKSFPYERVH